MALKANLYIIVVFLLIASGMGIFFLTPEPSLESYPLDDAWIHMVYARNFVDGEFFCYNATEPEAGFSSPMWLFCLSGVRLLTDSVLGAKIAGLIFLILLAFVCKKLGGVVAGVLILVDPLLNFSAVSGMEVTLFAFFCVLSIERSIANKPLQAGFASAGALLSRPEGVLIPFLLILLLIAKKYPFKESVKRSLSLLIPSLCAAGLWITFCLLVTGNPFPNTFYKKVESLFECHSLNFFTFIFRFLSDNGPLFPYAAIVLIITALIFCFNLRTVSCFLLFLGLILGVWASRCIQAVEPFYWERYLTPALAGFHIVLAIGLKYLWDKGKTYRHCALALGLVIAVSFSINLVKKQDLYVKNCNDIARYNVAAGKWLSENSLPNERIAVADAGAIKYFSNRYCIDIVGLNSKNFTNTSFLNQFFDAFDHAVLASYANTEWFVTYQVHFSGDPKFKIIKTFSYNDCSIYITPQPNTLLILRKGR